MYINFHCWWVEKQEPLLSSPPKKIHFNLMLSMASHSQHRRGWGVIWRVSDAEGVERNKIELLLKWKAENKENFDPNLRPFSYSKIKILISGNWQETSLDFPKVKLRWRKASRSSGKSSHRHDNISGEKFSSLPIGKISVFTFSQWWNFTHFPFFFFRSTLPTLKSPSTWHRIILFTRVEQRNQKLLRHLNGNAAASGNRKKGENGPSVAISLFLGLF